MAYQTTVRTDAASTEVKASGAFATSYAYSSAVDMRDFSGVAVWVIITSTTSLTEVDIVSEWTDDGSTITADGTSLAKADDSISTGTFEANAYTAKLTGTNLAVGKHLFYFPKRGGSLRIGAKANSATGAFSIRTQRLA